jgi:hypothetical protein
MWLFSLSPLGVTIVAIIGILLLVGAIGVFSGQKFTKWLENVNKEFTISKPSITSLILVFFVSLFTIGFIVGYNLRKLISLSTTLKKKIYF